MPRRWQRLPCQPGAPRRHAETAASTTTNTITTTTTTTLVLAKQLRRGGAGRPLARWRLTGTTR